MKVPFSWLKEYVSINISPEELAVKLLNSGFEVEGIEYLGKNLEKVFIGKITKITKHPNADKLRICTLNMGDKELIIVTAAQNVNEGDVVPVATDGALLPTGKTINTTVFRGIDSFGMLCSGEELCIDDSVIKGAEVDGILILPSDAPLGMDIKDYLLLNDYILDVSITSNRPDCNSVLGLAREISVVLKVKLKYPNFKFKTVEDDINKYLSVNIAAPELCSSYHASVVKDIKVAESPLWMRDRLRKCGIRAISNIVDITNYVLLEIGQPMHAFDMRFVEGNAINVRRAKKGEEIIALDGNKYILNENMLLICDSKKPIGIAGVMGGEFSGIKNDTSLIAFESAKFERGNIRLTSRTLGLRSASSARFEKGVDMYSVHKGMERALALIGELKCGTIINPQIAVDKKAYNNKTLSMELNDIFKLLGITVPDSAIIKILNSLEIVSTIKNGILTSEIPPFREDIENFADIAEEIIRVYGYDNIKSTLPEVKAYGGKSETQKVIEKLKSTLCAMGAFEAVTYSFINNNVFDKLMLDANDYRRKAVSIINPLSEEYGIMRTTMIQNALTTAATNLTRKNFDFRFFEISNVFIAESLPLKKLPKEPLVFSFTASGKDESFYTIKGVLEEVAAELGAVFSYVESGERFLHPGVSADIFVNNEKIGFFGQVHPKTASNFDIEKDVFIAELNLEYLLNSYNKKIRFKVLPKFQEIERDLAVTISDGIKAGEVLKAIENECGTLLESLELFDVYKGKQIEEGLKSLAFKLVFRSPERTLVDSEIAAIMDRVNKTLLKEFGAKLRQ